MSDQSVEKISLWQLLKSVVMSFLGVQKESVRERDFTHGNPKHFIIAGIILTIIFVGALILLVQLILRTS